MPSIINPNIEHKLFIPYRVGVLLKNHLGYFHLTLKNSGIVLDLISNALNGSQWF